MKNEKMFEVAVKNKFRFPFKGLVSVEDLWDLSIENLDLVFKSLNSQMKQVKEESLLNTKTKEDKELELKIEIVRYIVGVKQKEKEIKLKEQELKMQKQKILDILSSKQDEQLQHKSIDELKDMLDQLEN